MSCLTNLRVFLHTGFYFSYNLTSFLSYLSLLSFSHLLLSRPSFHFGPTLSVYQSSTFFFLSLPCLVSCFSFCLALCTRLNWQFSVSFQVHVKSSSSYRICRKRLQFIGLQWSMGVSTGGDGGTRPPRFRAGGTLMQMFPPLLTQNITQDCCIMSTM